MLLKRIKRQEADGNLDTAPGVFAVGVVIDKLAERGERQLTKPRSLAGEPVLIRRRWNGDAIEQITAIEIGGPCK